MIDALARYRVHILVAAMLLLPSLSMLLARGGSGRNPVDRAAINLLGPVQTGAAFGLGFIEDLWNDYVALRNMKEENERLRQEIAQLREERARLVGVLQENARLRQMLQLKGERPELELRGARVIAADVSPFFRVLRLRLDTHDADQKLEPRMAVVSHEGVVGQILEVYDDYVDVMLVSDPRSNIDVYTQRNRTRGMVYGLGHKRDYACRMGYLRRRDEVHDGDVLVTSGKGGIFPRELLVGTVTDVQRKEYGLNQEASVEPIVDVSRLEEVFIITGKAAPGQRP